MDDKHCDMCAWYDIDCEYCTLYREKHYPSDGEKCSGWKYWKDVESQNEET